VPVPQSAVQSAAGQAQRSERHPAVRLVQSRARQPPRHLHRHPDTNLEEAMPDAEYFHALARRCRTLARAAVVPEIKEQLSLWAVEFADKADEAEQHTPSTT